MSMSVAVIRTLFVIVALALGACGGGSYEAPVAATAPPVAPSAASGPAPAASNSIAGVFGATISDDQVYDLLYVVMSDGTTVGYLGTDWSNSFKFVDRWVGHHPDCCLVDQYGVRTGASNAVYRGEPVFVSTTFDMAIPRLSGLITVGPYLTTRTVAFGGGAIAGSSYRFDAPASVAAAEGRWELTDEVGEAVAVDIAPDGGLKVSFRGCSLTGSAKPSDGRENALMLSFDLDRPVPSNCQPNLDYWDIEYFEELTGFAIALPMTSGGTRLLMFLGSPGRWPFFAAVGQR